MRRGLQLHQCADDCQVYLSTSTEDVPHAADKFNVCLVDISVWLGASQLWLNVLKTELMWLGLTQLFDKITCQNVFMLGTCVAFSDTTRDLATVTDHEMMLAAHISYICRSSYNHLCRLKPVVRSLPVHDTKMLVQAFISCHLDYCNSLLYSINDGLLRRMQLVQNAAVHLVTGACQLSDIIR